MKRSSSTVTRSRDAIALYVVLVVVASLAHYRIQPLMDSSIELSLHPIATILTIYLGYSTGRWGGLFAGLLACLPWTIAVWLTNEQVTWWELLLASELEARDIPFVEVVPLAGVSIQSTLLTAAFGYATGAVVALVEPLLHPGGSRLRDLLAQAAPVAVLPSVMRLLSRWMGPSRDATSAPPSIASLISALYRPRTLRAFSAWLVLIALNAHFILECREGPWIQFLPAHCAPLLVLVLAFFTSARAGIGLSIVAWLGGWVLLGVWTSAHLDKVREAELGYESLDTLRRLVGFPMPASEEDEASGGFSAWLHMPSQLLGLSILAWCAGAAGEVARDDGRRRQLREWLGTFARRWTVVDRSAWLTPIVFLPLCLAARWQQGPVELAYQPALVLFVGICAWSLRRPPASTSNWLLAMLLWFTLLDYTQGVDRADRFVLQGFHCDAITLVLLCATPFVATSVDSTRIGNCRVLVFGFAAALLVRDVYLDSGIASESLTLGCSLRSVSQDAYGDPVFRTFGKLVVLSLALQFALCELCARWLHWTADRAARLHAPPIG